MTASSRVQYCYYAALAGYFGLFFLHMGWHTLLAPSKTFPVAMLLILSITPLLLPLMGFLHGKSRSHAWMAYISLIYFIHGVVETGATSSDRLYAMAEILFSLLLFFGSTFYIRFLSKP